MNRSFAAFVVIAAAFATAGCASSPSARTQFVPVPIATSCAPDAGPAPAWPDTDEALRAAPDLFNRVRLLAAGRLLRISRERELTAALEACRG